LILILTLILILIWTDLLIFLLVFKLKIYRRAFFFLLQLDHISKVEKKNKKTKKQKNKQFSRMPPRSARAQGVVKLQDNDGSPPRVLPVRGDDNLDTLLSSLGDGWAQALDSLEVEHCAVTDAGARALAALLRDPAVPLRSLCLDTADFDSNAAGTIAAAVKDSRFLQSLHMRSAGLGDGGARDLASALALDSHCALVLLDVHDNGITDSGCAALALALADHGAAARLKTLDLGGNPLGDPSAAQLAAMLRSTASVTKLMLKRTAIGDAGARCLAAAIAASDTLMTFDIEDAPLGPEGTAALAGAVAGGGGDAVAWDAVFGESWMRIPLSAAQRAAILPFLMTRCGPQVTRRILTRYSVPQGKRVWLPYASGGGFFYTIASGNK
jgi:hypothetical protein